jgi:predicted ATPase
MGSQIHTGDARFALKQILTEKGFGVREGGVCMAAALERLEVKGYKSIRDMDVTLKSLNILIGANGAGKTNFISIFRLLNAIVDQRLQEFVARSGGANSLLYFGKKRTDEIYLKLEFGENLYEATLVANDDDALFFGAENVYVWDRKKHDRPYKVSLGVGQRESYLKASTDNVAPNERVGIVSDAGA